MVKTGLRSGTAFVIAIASTASLAVLKGTLIPALPFTESIAVINGLAGIYIGKRLAQKTERFNGNGKVPD